jgi:arylsulfatase A-like enzyme
MPLLLLPLPLPLPLLLLPLLLASCRGERSAQGGGAAGGMAAAVPEAPGAAAISPEAAGFRTAIDLVANRAHASLHRNGRLEMKAAGPDFLKYVDGGWKTSWLLDEENGGGGGGAGAALVSGLSAVLFLAVDGDGGGAAADGASVLSIWMRALAPQQRASVLVNDRTVAALEVPEEPRRHDVALPAGVLRPGENRVRLTFRAAAELGGGRRAAAAVTAVALGPLGPGAPGADVAPAGLTVADGHAAAAAGARRRALVAGSGRTRISYHLDLPAGAHLAVAHRAGTGGGAASVRVAGDGRTTRTVYRASLGAAWQEALVDLGLPAAGGPARLDLIAEGQDVAWGEPRVVVRRPPPAAAPSRPRFDHVFVWMVDTLRADKLRAYNPRSRVVTPRYDAFIADATRFSWATVPGTWSLPSHASLLTGVYPTVHHATAHEARLSTRVPFLAEVMKKAGFRAGMFSSNGYISRKWGFDRGWDVNRNFIRESLPNGAEYLWKIARPWVAANVGHRQLVYLATIEPHVAYVPRREFLARYWKKPYRGPIKPALSGVQLGLIKEGKLAIGAEDRAYLEALYDGEISQSDAAFGAFIADLKALGIYDRSVVIVVSDHGDQFNEHGGLGHGDTVYQELTHVPLVIRAPGVLPPGHVVHADVEIMDVFATILDLAGVGAPPGTQGDSLVPLARDEIGAAPRAALTVDGQVVRGLKVGRHRLVHRGPDAAVELYDDEADPLEQRDVAAERPIAVRTLRGALGLVYAYETTWSKSTWGTAANLREAFYTAAGPAGRRGPEPLSGGPK